MNRLAASKPAIIAGNLIKTWKHWKQDFTLFLTEREYGKKPNEVKSSLLLHCIGVYCTALKFIILLLIIKKNTLVYDKIIETFEAYIASWKNLTYLQFKFLIYWKEEGKSSEIFFTDFKNFASDFELNHLKGSLIRNMIIICLYNKMLQKRLLRDINLTLDRTVEICKTIKQTKSHAQATQQRTLHLNDYDVDAIWRNQKDLGQSEKKEM